MVNVFAPIPLGLPSESLLCTGGAVTFALPAGFTAPHWSNGSTGNVIVVSSGATIEVDAIDENGCASSMVMVVFEEDCGIEIPNVFTPNGDGTNDGWLPSGGFVAAQAEIYNRWGGLVYEGNMVARAWDGRHHISNELCPEGVYYAVVNFARYDGSVIKRSAYFQLNR
jgi:gliding motility-associated-like protein